MGRLTTRENLDIPLTWYLKDQTSINYKTTWQWPSPQFPYIFHIHQETLDKDPDTRILIRRWIESSIMDTVLYDCVDHSYRKFYGHSWEWEKGYDISNRWIRFHFEDNQSATMFALKFSDLILPITQWHPDHPEDDEYLKLPENEKYIK